MTFRLSKIFIPSDLLMLTDKQF